MLQEPLYQYDVVTVGVVNACGVPLAEAVGADVLIAKMIAHKLEVVLDLANAYGEQKGVVRNLVRVCILPEKAVDFIRNGELSLLPGLLLGDVQSPAVAITEEVCHVETQDVSNAHPQIRLGC